jgi:hypothetical protein
MLRGPGRRLLVIWILLVITTPLPVFAVSSGTQSNWEFVVVSHGMCHGVDSQTGICQGPATNFLTTDDVYSWTDFDKVVTSHDMRWQWVRPDGSILRDVHFTFCSKGHCGRDQVWDNITTSIVGNWSVKVSVDGRPLFSDSFEMSKGGYLTLLPSSQIPVEVDGRVTGDEWSDSQAFSLKPAPFYSESEATGEARISFKRDPQNLYVLCEFISVTEIDRPPKRSDACYLLWQTSSMNDNDAIGLTLVWSANASKIAISTSHRFTKPPPLFYEIASSFSFSPTPTNSTPHLLIEASIPLLTLSYGLTQIPDMQIYPRLFRGVLPKGSTQFILGTDSAGYLIPLNLRLLYDSLQFKFDVGPSALVHVDTSVRVEPLAWDLWTSYNLTYTGDVKNVTSSDNLGALNTSLITLPNQVQVHVLFRNPVHDGYEFTISFDLPDKVHSIGARNVFDFSWTELTTQSVEVKLPEGASDVILKTNNPAVVGVISSPIPTTLNLGKENPVTFTNSLPQNISSDQDVFSWSISWIQKEVTIQSTTVATATSLSNTPTASRTSQLPWLTLLVAATVVIILTTIIFHFFRKRGWQRKVSEMGVGDFNPNLPVHISRFKFHCSHH